ncbi:hypothetical protein DH2020_026975 [Rehmannia glutinosa]|uniref:Uncharacterized protein n=1 Tax=Rehmannia glutinosa TaxID=99300 RepID=A0ABR0VVD7_REHGL
MQPSSYDGSESEIVFVVRMLLEPGTLNAFRAMASTYHMKLKFPVGGSIWEVVGDQLISISCYVETIKMGERENKKIAERNYKPGRKKSKKLIKLNGPVDTNIPPHKELIMIDLVPRDTSKTTCIGSQLDADFMKRRFTNDTSCYHTYNASLKKMTNTYLWKFMRGVVVIMLRGGNGREKLYAVILPPRMKRQAHELVQHCEKCQKHAPLIHQSGEEITAMSSPCPFSQ